VSDLDALKAEVEKIKKAIGIETSAKKWPLSIKP
jgi:hypothetical protein